MKSQITKWWEDYTMLNGHALSKIDCLVILATMVCALIGVALAISHLRFI